MRTLKDLVESFLDDGIDPDNVLTTMLNQGHSEHKIETIIQSYYNKRTAEHQS